MSKGKDGQATKITQTSATTMESAIAWCARRGCGPRCPSTHVHKRKQRHGSSSAVASPLLLSPSFSLLPSCLYSSSDPPYPSPTQAAPRHASETTLPTRGGRVRRLVVLLVQHTDASPCAIFLRLAKHQHSIITPSTTTTTIPTTPAPPSFVLLRRHRCDQVAKSLPSSRVHGPGATGWGTCCVYERG